MSTSYKRNMLFEPTSGWKEAFRKKTKIVQRSNSVYELIMEQREAIMFCAIIWVLLSHTAISTLGIPFFSFLCKIGYGGVDIFMFLSGIGIYTSIDKNSDIIAFYKRRINRIMPAYVIVLTLAFIAYPYLPSDNWHRAATVDYGYFADFLGNISGLSFYQGRRTFNWYVPGIIIIYFISPLLYEVIKKCKTYRHYIMYFGGVMFLCIPCYNSDLMKVTARLFLYSMGMMVSKYRSEKTCFNVSTKTLFLLSILSILGIVSLHEIWVYREPWLNKFGLFFIPFVLATPGFVLWIACIAKRFEDFFVIRIMNRIGKYTLGIYLMNIYLTSCTNLMININLFHISKINIILSYMTSVIESIMLGVLLEVTISWFRNCKK